jgi:hypothetical protein
MRYTVTTCIFAFICSLGLSGCITQLNTAPAVSSSWRPYFIGTRLTDIPTPPNAQRNIEVFFPGERLPDSPYVKIAILNGDGGATDDQVESLKERAKVTGADAIFLINPRVYIDTNHSSSSYMDAVAIKYVHNINYLDQYIKRKRLYFRDTTDWKEEGLIEYQINGDITKQQCTSQQWLYRAIRTDLYTFCPPSDLIDMDWTGINTIERTQWMIPRSTQFSKSYKYRFVRPKNDQRIKYVQLSRGERAGSRMLETYHYIYTDDKERPAQRRLELTGETFYEVIQYNAKGNISEVIWYSDREMTQQVFRVTNEYFSQDDLKELL